MEREALAHHSDDPGRYSIDLSRRGEAWIVRRGPLLMDLLRDLRNGVAPAVIARVTDAIKAGRKEGRTRAMVATAMMVLR